MTPIAYKIWHTSGGKSYPVKIEHSREMALASLDSLRQKSREAGFYYIQPIYPVKEMKTEQLDKFVALCDNVLTLQDDYYSSRTVEAMREAIIEETKLDNYISATRKKLSSMPDYTPNEKAKAFFDLVAQWRMVFKSYHAYRKQKDCDPQVAREKKKHADKLRLTISEVVRQYKAAANIRNP